MQITDHFLFRILVVLFPHIGLSIGVQAQTGPGGVGNSANNVIWFSADQGVAQASSVVSGWADRSGNGNNASQATANYRPLVQNNAINGYPALVFDNDEVAADHLRVPDNATLESMNAMTAFAVYELFDGTAAGAPRGIFCKRVSPSSNVAYGWFHWNSGGTVTQHLDIDGTTNRINGGSINTNRVYVNGFKFQGSNPSNTQNQVLYRDGAAVANGAEPTVTIPNYASDFFIGSLYGHTGSGSTATRFNGRIAEVVVYRAALNNAQRIIVNNYLSAKYGTLLAAEDLYTMDNASNGDHDHDVAGIGRTDASNLQTDSRGSGSIRINAPNGLDDGEFLFWGHDNGIMGSWGVSDRPVSVQGRLARVWRVSEVDIAGAACDVGAVDLYIDLNGLGTVNAEHLRLLVDVDGDGTFSDESPIGGAADTGGGIYRFTGVTALANGRRFTIGTTDITATPLPVELISFTAKARENGSAELNWTTATESGSDHFRVERSSDLEEWQEVGILEAAGTSTSMIDYSMMDLNAPHGSIYYKLIQLDQDGTAHEKGIAVVNISAPVEFRFYPNPAEHFITILTGSKDPAEALILDPGGRVIAREMIGGSSGTINTSRISPGQYLIQLEYADGSSSAEKLVIGIR